MSFLNWRMGIAIALMISTSARAEIFEIESEIDQFVGQRLHTALITGGSRGIGGGLADTLAKAGVNLVLVARDALQLKRKKMDLLDLARSEGHEITVHTVSTDLSDPEKSKRALLKLPKQVLREIDVYAFSAGSFVADRHKKTRPQKYQNMILTKTEGAPAVTEVVLKSIADRPLAANAHYRLLTIIVSSFAAKFPMGDMEGYSGANISLSRLGDDVRDQHNDVFVHVAFSGMVKTDLVKQFGEHHPALAWGVTEVEEEVTGIWKAVGKRRVEYMSARYKRNLKFLDLAAAGLGGRANVQWAQSFWSKAIGDSTDPGPLYNNRLLGYWARIGAACAQALVGGEPGDDEE